MINHFCGPHGVYIVIEDLSIWILSILDFEVSKMKFLGCELLTKVYNYVKSTQTSFKQYIGVLQVQTALHEWKWKGLKPFSDEMKKWCEIFMKEKTRE